MLKPKIFKNLIDSTLADELYKGSKIIYTFFPEDTRGYLVIERSVPVKEENGDREFWFAAYEILEFPKGSNLYLATNYVKLRKSKVLELAKKSFYNKW